MSFKCVCLYVLELSFVKVCRGVTGLVIQKVFKDFEVLGDLVTIGREDGRSRDFMIG